MSPMESHSSSSEGDQIPALVSKGVRGCCCEWFAFASGGKIQPTQRLPIWSQKGMVRKPTAEVMRTILIARPGCPP